MINDTHDTVDTHAHRGRPAKIWSGYVKEDFSYLRMAFDWDRVAQDRKWRKSIQELLEHVYTWAG